MFEDLENGVAELFEEAGGYGKRFVFDEESSATYGLYTNNWFAKRAYLENWENLVTREIRELRDKREPYVIQPCRIESAMCSGCGDVLEKREGSDRIFHVKLKSCPLGPYELKKVFEDAAQRVENSSPPELSVPVR